MKRTGALALACLLALSACTVPDAPATPSADVTAALGRVTEPDAVITFPRTLQAARLVEAQVHIARDADAAVISATLDSPLFADSPARDGRVRLFADWDNRVRVPLGTAVCPAPDGEIAEGDTTVILTLEVDGEEVTEVVTADDAALRKINAEECAAQAVLDVATPSFGAIESQDASLIDTTIVVTRGDSKPEEPVTLSGMTGNIVFIVRLDEDGPRTLAAGEESIAVPAEILVGRCDPHVFAESKKTFVFPVRLAVGDAEPGYVEIQPDDVTRAAMQQLFEDCGEAEREG